MNQCKNGGDQYDGDPHVPGFADPSVDDTPEKEFFGNGGGVTVLIFLSSIPAPQRGLSMRVLPIIRPY